MVQEICHHWLEVDIILLTQVLHYFLGGKSLVVGRMPLASKKARSVFSQRRKVSGLTPAARASSIFVRDFINITHFYQLLYTSFFCLCLLVPSASLRYPFGRKKRKDDVFPLIALIYTDSPRFRANPYSSVGHHIPTDYTDLH